MGHRYPGGEKWNAAEAERAADRDREVMALINQGNTQAEVGRLLGLSRQRVHQIVQRAQKRS